MTAIQYTLTAIYLTPFALFASSTSDKTPSIGLDAISELGFKAIPNIMINYKHDDNITNTKANHQASHFTEIIPSLRIEGQKYNNLFSFAYQARQSLYGDNTDLNYTDHQFHARLSRDMNKRHRLAFSYQFDIGHDPANTGISEGNEQITTPAIFYTQSTQLSYSYGSKTSKAILEPRFGFNDKRYDDNSGNDVSMANFDEYNYGLSIYYNIAASLKILFDMSSTTSDYAGNNKQKDSQNGLVYTGLNWDITGKTKGSLKVGYEKINFADSTKDSQASPSWDIGVSWYPKTYSVFTLNTKQKITQAILNTDSIKTNSNSISWQHKWRHNLSSSLSYNNLREKYQSSAREDISNAINISFSYQFRYWLAFGLSYEYKDKSSSESQFEYDKNIYGLTSKFVF
ncbi:outer membrane beta-barrel protein [Moritella sp. 24]|uniref:outer membrane beta-barrel protein n=1 Tax=Moritella sp. 24 TaxID=2746230 RepID=UPI001BAA7AA5|nr:outer membrane beta-barrel protein [Moritella sp. 24]QUM78287.1 outer membrane beta-barrel protein [Moritella sp. 24]